MTRKTGRETFTLAPSVRLDPEASPDSPVRAAFPWLEPPPGLRLTDLGPGGEDEPNVRPALLAAPFADPYVEGSVRCDACAHRCVVRPGRTAVCGVRQNRGGTLYTLVYGQLVATKAEPIEKKPLYHFLPGSLAYSIATRGCNFHCAYCQNWEMAQGHRAGVVPESRYAAPEAVVREALEAGVRSIAYTYVEPTVFLEYALDTMALARAAGLRNVWVTNGYETAETIELVAPYLDGANVDLKAGSDRVYRRLCGARLAPVQDAIVTLRAHGVWVELTTLVVPGFTNVPGELAAIAGWISSAIGPETPWHVSRFEPAHRLASLDPTPAAALLEAATIGRRAGLRHVYVGNAPELGGESTRCAGCGELLIERAAFGVTARRLVDGRCARCGWRLAGVGLDG